jgi:hypothetical protein
MRVAVGVVIGALLSASTASYGAIPAGSEFQVNTYTTGFQGPAAVVRDGNGFVVAWNAYGGDVLAQRFDSLGTRLGTEFQVNDPAYGASLPAMAAGGAGGFVVVWTNYGRDGSSQGLFARRFDSLGTAIGSEFQVNTYTQNRQYQPAIAPEGSGGFAVVWSSTDQDGSGRGVFGQRLDSLGAVVGSEFQVNTYTTGIQDYPAVGGDGTGFVVAWRGSDGDIFAQRFDSAGGFDGTEFQVNTNTSGQQRKPDVEELASGFVIVWTGGADQDGDSYGIFGQRFDGSGAPSGTEFQINSYTTGAQEFPLGTSEPSPSWVAGDGSGGFLVTWMSDYTTPGQDGDRGGVFARHFDSSGAPAGTEFQVNTYTTHRQFDMVLAGDGAGGFVVVWNSYGQDGDTGGIFAQRFVEPQATGAPCGESVACETGNCVDGVCCDTPCSDPMQACNIAGSAGTCTSTLAPGDPCSDATQCESTNCADGVCCNDPCTGVMEACNVSGSVGTCTPTAPLGEPCDDGTQCESTFCADAVCCDQACTGPDQACNQIGRVGTCTQVTSPVPAASTWGVLILVAGLILVAFFAIRDRTDPGSGRSS